MAPPDWCATGRALGAGAVAGSRRIAPISTDCGSTFKPEGLPAVPASCMAGTAGSVAALAALGRKRHARLAVPHFLLVPEIVARSDMISALPERLALGYANKLRILEPPVKLDTPFCFVSLRAKCWAKTSRSF